MSGKPRIDRRVPSITIIQRPVGREPLRITVTGKPGVQIEHLRGEIFELLRQPAYSVASLQYEAFDSGTIDTLKAALEPFGISMEIEPGPDGTDTYVVGFHTGNAPADRRRMKQLMKEHTK